MNVVIIKISMLQFIYIYLLIIMFMMVKFNSLY